MQVVMDNRWSGGGIGRYFSEISARLAKSVSDVSYIDGSDISVRDPLGPLKLGARIRKLRGDVFWSPGFIPPLFANMPSVLTVHDLIHLEHGSTSQKKYFNYVIRPIIKRSSSILTVSQFSKSTIVKWLSIDPEKVVVAGNAVDAIYNPTGARHQQGRPYLLYVGNYRSHKNLIRMIQAFSISGIGKDFDLMLTGKPDESLMAAAKKFSVSKNLKFVGGVAEEDLPSIYRGSSGLVLISLIEGFGLPVLEAMACGVPVLCSNTTALSEIAGDAAFKVDPRDVDRIAEGMKLLVFDESARKAVSGLGICRAKQFSWDKSAQTVHSVLALAASKQ